MLTIHARNMMRSAFMRSQLEASKIGQKVKKNLKSHFLPQSLTSRKHLRKKVTPDLHLTYSKNWGNLGLVLNDKKWKFLHKIMCCGDLFE